MRSLIIKIFLAYWLAAGVVIIISDFEPHRHIHNPELIDALNASLQFNAQEMIAHYETGSCESHVSGLDSSDDRISLVDASGRIVCGSKEVEGASTLALSALRSGKRETANGLAYQTIATPTRSPAGTPYVLLFKNRYKGALQVGGFLPGYTTICISGVVTLFLAYLVAFPIRRLRNATKKIASGALETRVPKGAFSKRLSAFRLEDDLDGLVVDFNGMADRIQTLVDAQKTLLRDISHELRSPLARVNVALSLAREGKRESLHLHLERIELESARLNSLIGQILSLSYVENLDIAPRLENLRLSSIVRELLPDAQYEAEALGCSVVLNIKDDCLVVGNRDLLRQAFENIVRNAIRYSPCGAAVEIELAVHLQDKAETAMVRIMDRGPGVPEAELAAILRPFYRVGNLRHGPTEGTGIGLAIANRAITVHGGFISARNRESGQGLIVEIAIPSLARTVDPALSFHQEMTFDRKDYQPT